MITSAGLDYKNARSIYNKFTPEELTEIENEAWEVRRKRTAATRARVYDTLGRRAIEGNVPAIREFLDRTEGKVTKPSGHSTPTESQRDLIVNVIGVTPEDIRKDEQ